MSKIYYQYELDTTCIRILNDTSLTTTSLSKKTQQSDTQKALPGYSVILHWFA